MLSGKTLSFLLLGALSWLLLLSSPSSTALAAPTPVEGIEGLSLIDRAEKPDLPKSKDDLKNDYFKGAPKKDKSCFFTAMDVSNEHKPAQNVAKAKQWCKDSKLTNLEQIWEKNNILNQGEWKKPIAANDWNNFIVWVSEVFAEESSGAAFLLIPENDKPRKQSIFYSKEFPQLKDKVDKIMNVKFDYDKKPDLPDIKKDDHVWWKKGAADPPTRDQACEPSAPECS